MKVHLKVFMRDGDIKTLSYEPDFLHGPETPVQPFDVHHNNAKLLTLHRPEVGLVEWVFFDADRRPRAAGDTATDHITIRTGAAATSYRLVGGLWTPCLVPMSHHARKLGVEKPKVLDLFCGAGGLSLGFHQAGYRVVAGVDYNAKAIETYKKSFVDFYSPATLALDEPVSMDVVDRVGNFDLIVGGPPCQLFSTIRRKAGGDVDDPRAKLIDEYIEIIREYQPKAFVIENVRGLYTHDKGRKWKALQELLESTGYSVYHKLIKCEELGIPQRRARIIIVGLRPDVAKRLPDEDFPWPATVDTRRTVGDTLELYKMFLPPLKTREKSELDMNHRARSHNERTLKLFSLMGPGESMKDAIDRGFKARKGFDPTRYGDTYGRLDPDRPAPTITGGCTTPSKGRFTHPYQDRGLTTREAALLQTFPPDYNFYGGMDASSQQVGNAVPPHLAYLIAMALKPILEEAERL